MNEEGGGSPVKLRSIYVSSTDDIASHDAEAQTQTQTQSRLADGNGRLADTTATNANNNNGDDYTGGEDDTIEDLYDSEPEPIQLPESTHTLFFTTPVFSVPFFFALVILIISMMCLGMALVDNLHLEDLEDDNPLNVPANVGNAVRIAQYLGILIALLMEEEIPTGLHLLRTIRSSSFKKKFPNKSYAKFVGAAVLRVVIGYFFLGNVFIILAQADGVLDIFYDVLALQFISELDDIAFSLCRLDVFGGRMRRACTMKLFQTEFEKQKFARSKKSSLLLKSIYFVNLAALLAGMITISIRQTSGHYQCNSISVDFGDEVWEDAVVEEPPGSNMFEERVLVFSTFNGVYIKNRVEHGRPVYQEMRKNDPKPFFARGIVPAEIKYNKEAGAWIFAHPHIRNSVDEAGWLLRSPDTETFDLLEVENEWSLWKGKIDSSKVSYACNTCSSKLDCNLNGQCIDGECQCIETRPEVEYLGTHCQVKVKDSCRTIVTEPGALPASVANETTGIKFSMAYRLDGSGIIVEEYSRPIYQYVGGSPEYVEGDINWIMYTGRRWISLSFNLFDSNITVDEVVVGLKNYHTFWHPTFSFSSDGLRFISDPTTADSPVGVDWYYISEKGSQFGPFGALMPMQLNQTAGRGLFRCDSEFIPVPEIKSIE